MKLCICIGKAIPLSLWLVPEAQMSCQCDITVNEEFSLSSVGCYFLLTPLPCGCAKPQLKTHHLSARCRRRLHNLCDDAIKPVAFGNLLPCDLCRPELMTFTHSSCDFKSRTCSTKVSKSSSVMYSIRRDEMEFFLLMGCCAKRNKVTFHQCDLSGPLTVSWRCTTAIKILGEVFT